MRISRTPRWIWQLAIGCAVLIGPHALATTSMQVVDQQGKPLADAVVELIGSAADSSQAPKGTMTQQGLMFVPFVLAVQAGTAVEFPNLDKTRHHVYSFSEAKVFELKLYAGKPEKPVLFDKPGIVVLGCNIHDHMQAFVYVGTSPYLAVSDEQGQVTFAKAPAGTVKVRVWHPWQQAALPEQQLELQDKMAALVLPITAQEKPKPPKRGFGQSY